jgi:hypothetical protein
MCVIVPGAVFLPVALGISMSVGILVHPLVFYFDTSQGAASAQSPVVGWLTTLPRELIDAFGSRCHYQKS